MHPPLHKILHSPNFPDIIPTPNPCLRAKISLPMSPVSITSMPNFDQVGWVIQIRQTLEEELEDEEDIPVCIFNVPKLLMSCKPDAYVPQQIAIGPYHYWRQELYEMERYKLAAAKRTQKRLQNCKFQQIVGELINLEPTIRGCYHKYLDFNSETLAWMMAVDMSFLLEYLQSYSIKAEGKILTRVSSRMSHLMDSKCRKSAHNAILRDIVMLENQIPLFGLRKFLEFEYSSLEQADEALSSMLCGLCQEVSPFNIAVFPCVEISEIAHLLDFIYKIIVPKSEVQSEIIPEEEAERTKSLERDASLSKAAQVKQFFGVLWKLLSKLNKGPILFIKNMLFSKPLKLLTKLPWNILTKIPCFSIIRAPLERLILNQGKEDEKAEGSTSIHKPPLIEEITIPSVTELYESGVRFVPTKGDLKSISFDVKTVTFQLPSISLDVNSETILRNLVAYETSTAPGPLVFTRYTELMCGIIDTEEDVKLLREKGVVLNYMKSDGEAAELWNGMSKSVRLTRVPYLDKVILDVNKYYNGRLRIKLRNYVRTYVFGSWKLLTLLAAIFMLLLTMMQAFCSVYRCNQVFRLPFDDATIPSAP